MTIIFYDFPSKTVNAPWNPNTWKVRCARDAPVATSSKANLSFAIDIP